MSVKAKQLGKSTFVKTPQSETAVKKTMRGFAGNHTLNKNKSMEGKASGEHGPANANNESSSNISAGAEEKEADRFAQSTMKRDSPRKSVALDHNAPTQFSTTSGLSPKVQQMLSSSGRPLAPSQRVQFEPMLGESLADVRVHEGAAADVAARNVNASALTVGSHIGFATGQYAPGTARGDYTLAHELAHVAQQRTHGPARVRYFIPRQVVRAVQLLPYRALFDAIDEARKYRLESLPLLNLMRDLAVALVDRDVEQTKKVVADLLPAVKATFVTAGQKSSLDSVVFRLIGDLIELELFDEARQLRQAFTADSEWVGVRTKGQEEREHILLSNVVDRVIDELDVSSPGSTEAGINRLLRVFFSIASEVPLYKGDTPWENLLKQLAVVAVTAFQVLMDSATDELQAGAGTTRELSRAREVLSRLVYIVLSHYPVDTVLPVEVTRSNFEAKPNPRHLDYFQKDSKAPWVGISAYSRTDATFSEKNLGLRRILEIRAEQLDALERIFGIQKDQSGQVPEAVKENAQAIAAIGPFRLHDNESWRDFSLQKFRLAKARLGDDGQALTATINVLRTYLQAFTIHTPYNIDDFGDEYLSKSFPRALTGQLIHDCGVYALRIAYALSLVRKELDLDFRAIVLPVHVGLIISFKNRDYPAFITHNNDLFELDEIEAADLRERWVKSKGPLAMRYEHQDFLEHVAAGRFIAGVDLPYRTETIPDVPDVKNIKKRHAALWDHYLKKLVAPEVLQPVSGVDQPELMFLAVIESQREIHDAYLVPLWRRGHEWWKRHESFLQRAMDQYQPQPPTGNLVHATQVAASNLLYREEVQPHWEELWNISASWRKAIVAHDKIRQDVAAFMKANPGALEPSARLTHWGKFLMPWEEEQEFWEYVGDPGNEVDRLETDSAVAFARVVAKGNSNLLSGDILPPWSVSGILRPND